MEFLTLEFVWAGLIAFAVLAYVVLDGFDLGIGILFPFMRDARQRDTMMNTVAPFWDGNETWLVLGGGGLLAVFPLAYAVVLPALYAPLTAMLLALVFRGVAFEFRHRTEGAKFLWDWSFALGSMVATFAQGIALGALVQGIPVEDRAYAGGWWDWLTPFSILTGIALVTGYVLLGSTWLGDEDRRPAATARAPLCLDQRLRHAGADRRRQPVDAVPGVPVLRALVRLADRGLQRRRAGADRALGLLALHGPAARPRPPGRSWRRSPSSPSASRGSGSASTPISCLRR